MIDKLTIQMYSYSEVIGKPVGLKMWNVADSYMYF